MRYSIKRERKNIRYIITINRIFFEKEITTMFSPILFCFRFSPNLLLFRNPKIISFRNDDVTQLIFFSFLIYLFNFCCCCCDKWNIDERERKNINYKTNYFWLSLIRFSVSLSLEKSLEIYHYKKYIFNYLVLLYKVDFDNNEKLRIIEFPLWI